MSDESNDFEKFNQVISYLLSPITKTEKRLTEGTTIMIFQRSDNKEFHVAFLSVKEKAKQP